MGGGGTRKTSDIVRINRPKPVIKRRGGGNGGGSGGGQEHHQDINQVCPPTFKVRVKPGQILVEGSRVTLRDDHMFVRGQDIGTLSAKDMRTLKDCAEEGINYRGEIIIVRDTYYVRFAQD